jgi:membrane-associated PAP2 superfamily phosphatase
MTRTQRTAILDWAVPIVLLVLLTLPFWLGDLDVRVARHLYVPGAGWPLGAEEPWRFLKHYGVVPAWIIAIGALGVWIASFFRPALGRARRGAMFLVFVMAIGPGVLVNDVFKEQWGRPRPRDLVEFGGAREYVAPLIKSPPEHGGSFASGHAATGFYLLTPYFLLRRRWPRRAAGVLVAGMVYGSLVGYARMVQGAHFMSDVLWALGIVYLTALVLFYLLRLQGVPHSRAVNFYTSKPRGRIFPHNKTNKS